MTGISGTSHSSVPVPVSRSKSQSNLDSGSHPSRDSRWPVSMASSAPSIWPCPSLSRLTWLLDLETELEKNMCVFASVVLKSRASLGNVAFPGVAEILTLHWSWGNVTRWCNITFGCGPVDSMSTAVNLWFYRVLSLAAGFTLNHHLRRPGPTTGLQMWFHWSISHKDTSPRRECPYGGPMRQPKTCFDLVGSHQSDIVICWRCTVVRVRHYCSLFARLLFVCSFTLFILPHF